MREFLSDPLFWIREAIRWRWQEVLMWTAITMGAITVSHLLT